MSDPIRHAIGHVIRHAIGDQIGNCMGNCSALKSATPLVPLSPCPLVTPLVANASCLKAVGARLEIGDIAVVEVV